MLKVLVTVLDWGLGHATRCIPVIRELQQQQCEVSVGGSGASLALLKQEFPSLSFYDLPGYAPAYPVRGSMVWKMAWQLPKFLRVIRREHQIVEDLVEKNGINGIISDNRYGCWSRKIPSVLITHQSNILMPARFGWLSRFVRLANTQQMKKFSWCWIPDSPGNSLAGELISFGRFPADLAFEYIGHLSRFTNRKAETKRYDVLAILSGPEPQRTVLENLILPQLKVSGLKYFMVRGLPSSNGTNAQGNTVDFMTTEPLQALIASSDIVIARSGYSTVMDMALLQKKVVFVPTPGQTEQEYLAQRLMEAGIAFSISQKDFTLQEALEKSKLYRGFPLFQNDETLLKNGIRKFIIAIS